MRKKLGMIICVSAIGIGVAIAGQRVFGAEDIKAQIEAANAKFVQIFEAGDAAGVAARYTKDGQVLAPGSDTVSGTAAIEAFWKAGMQAGVPKLTLTTLEAEQHGDTAIEVGRAGIFDAQGNQLDASKYIVIWKRVNGEWKLHRDIFNAMGPAK